MNPESLDRSIQNTLSDLYPPFEATAPTVLSQLFQVIEERYQGDALKCLLDFLITAKHILESVQQAACAQYSDVVFRCEGWPLCLHEKVVIQLASINPLLLRPGDFYLQVAPFSEQSARIVVRSLLGEEEGQGREVEETPIPETSYPCIFTEDWLAELNHGRHGTLLSHCILSTDQGMVKVPWAQVALPEFVDKPRSMALSSPNPAATQQEKVARPVPSLALPPPASGYSVETRISPAKHGIAVSLCLVDSNCSRLVKVDQDRPVAKPIGWVSPNTWDSRSNNTSEVEGEYIDLVEFTKQKEALLSGAHSYTHPRAPIFRPVTLNRPGVPSAPALPLPLALVACSLMSLTGLHKLVEGSQLTSGLEGTLPYNHIDWLQLHQGFLLYSNPSLPLWQDVQRCILEQRTLMKDVLEDRRLVVLQREGGAMLARLRRESDLRYSHCEDYSDAVDSVTCMYNHVEEQAHVLVHRSNMSLEEWFDAEGERRLLEAESVEDSRKRVEQTLRSFSAFLTKANVSQSISTHPMTQSGDTVSCRNLSAHESPKFQKSRIHSHSIWISILPFFQATELAKDCRQYLDQVVRLPETDDVSTLQMYQESFVQFSPELFQEVKGQACALRGSRGMRVWNVAWLKCQEVRQQLEERLQDVERALRNTEESCSVREGAERTSSRNTSPSVRRCEGTTSLASSEEKAGNIIKLQRIMAELLLTEREYVRSLGYILTHYLPLLERPDVPQDLRGKRGVIFGNLEKLYDFHSHFFLRELDACQTEPLQVARCFLRHRDSLGLYALYSKNKPQSDALILHHRPDIFKRKQQELGDHMDLSSYLLRPIQRISKYSLLLQDMLGMCGPQRDREELQAAAEVVRFQMRHGNDLLTMDAIQDCDVNLKEQGQLIRQDEFIVFFRKKKCSRRIFLFQDLILFSKTKKTNVGNDVYIYKQSFKTSDIGMTHNSRESGFCFEIWFRRRKFQDTYTLKADRAEVKRAWTRDLEQILWEQATYKLRIQERVFMGTGRNPFMDIQPNEAAICDRATNCVLLGRGNKSTAKSHTQELTTQMCSSASTSCSHSSSSSGRGSLPPVGYPGNQIQGGETNHIVYSSPETVTEDDPNNHHNHQKQNLHLLSEFSCSFIRALCFG
uniref:Uncharacterized protein n=1 Tax=Oncorhynchus tshawytscha TaxID=74940 RepID=A0A8C8KAX9_ONCTS